MHILMVRFSSMGDVVLQTATVNWLRSLFGERLVISFVTSQEFTSLVNQHPGINEVIGFDRRGGEKWKDFIKKIDQLDEKQPIDLIMDLHATLRSFRLKFDYWSIPSLTVDKRRWERFFLTKIKSTKIKKLFNLKLFGLESQVERIIKDFEAIFGGTQGMWKTREFRRGPHGELTSLEACEPFALPRPYVVVSPSASFFFKRWSIDSFVRLTQELLENTSLDVVILAGPADDFCLAFEQIKSERLHNLQGKTSLKESMRVLARAKLSIGNDSGMNHIAEAYGVPCLTLFGPTDPRFGFAPHGNKSSYISKELWCKPCSTTGKKACYREKHFCMEMISVEEVRDEALRLLEEK